MLFFDAVACIAQYLTVLSGSGIGLSRVKAFMDLSPSSPFSCSTTWAVFYFRDTGTTLSACIHHRSVYLCCWCTPPIVLSLCVPSCLWTSMCLYVFMYVRLSLCMYTSLSTHSAVSTPLPFPHPPSPPAVIPQRHIFFHIPSCRVLYQTTSAQCMSLSQAWVFRRLSPRVSTFFSSKSHVQAPVACSCISVGSLLVPVSFYKVA